MIILLNKYEIRCSKIQYPVYLYNGGLSHCYVVIAQDQDEFKTARSEFSLSLFHSLWSRTDRDGKEEERL